MQSKSAFFYVLHNLSSRNLQRKSAFTAHFISKFENLRSRTYGENGSKNSYAEKTSQHREKAVKFSRKLDHESRVFFMIRTKIPKIRRNLKTKIIGPKIWFQLQKLQKSITSKNGIYFWFGTSAQSAIVFVSFIMNLQINWSLPSKKNNNLV